MSPALPHPNDISTLHRKKLHSLLIEGAAADSKPLIISVVTSLHLSGGLQSQSTLNPTLGGMSADSLMPINPSDLHKQANFLPLTGLRTITKHILASRRPN